MWTASGVRDVLVDEFGKKERGRRELNCHIRSGIVSNVRKKNRAFAPMICIGRVHIRILIYSLADSFREQ